MSDSDAEAFRLMPAKRRFEISALFAEDAMIRIDELADRFGVSRETIRRDLIVLETRGLVERVHGGGMRLEVQSREPSFDERVVLRSEHKAAMGEVAASLIGSAESVFLGIGTSVSLIADNLPKSFSGQVVTNSVIAATRLGDRVGLDVILCGGRMRHGDLAISGPQAADFLADMFVEIAFLGCGGVHPSHGITDFYLDEVALKRIVIGNARSTYVLADASKIGRVATKRVCAPDQIAGIVTDCEADTQMLGELQALGVETHCSAS